MTAAPAWIAATAASSPSHLIDDSPWMFAAIEVVHLLGIALFGGSLLAVDMSVLGVGFRPAEIRPLEGQVRPWLWAGLSLIVISGVLMFIAEPEKCYFNPAFRFKMMTLGLAAISLTTIRHGALQHLDDQITRVPARLKAISALSVGLWLAVGAGGRAIGFY